MKFSVYIIQDAELDIIDIYNYIAENDSFESADYVFNKLEELCQSLSEFPNRGHCPPELEYVNIRDYLEIHYKSYRIIYQIIGKKVFIHCVLDGRRDLPELLHNRLIRQ